MMSTILVIDDDEIFLAVVTKLLGTAGYAVHSTADGPRAIAMFQTIRPDIVLLDIGLPSMSGIEVLHALRKIDAHAKVVVVTGYRSDALKQAALMGGASEVLHKPIRSDVLIEKIRLALSLATLRQNHG